MGRKKKTYTERERHISKKIVNSRKTDRKEDITEDKGRFRKRNIGTGSKQCQADREREIETHKDI